MQFKSIIGQEEVKERLLKSYHENRVAHTQLFLGPNGSGSLALAIAYAQFINCKSKADSDSCGICPSCVKFQKYAHPDFHMFFPTTTTETVKSEPRSELFLTEWRQYLEKSKGYVTQNGWYEHLGVGNKQGTIFVRDAADIIQKMVLKNYEANYKIVIIWLAEKMNLDTSNKLLKTFEEPPANTLIFLISERFELLIPTVRSRAQLVKVPRLSDSEVADALLTEWNVQPEKAKDISLIASGDYNLAQDILQHAEETQANFINLRQWLRLCLKSDNVIELNKFNNEELIRIGREKQKSFLVYALESIHYALLHNSGNSDRVFKNDEELEFSKRLAPLINQSNLTEIYSLLNEAVYHIERNAHAGILFSDLSFKLGELLNKGRAKQSA